MENSISIKLQKIHQSADKHWETNKSECNHYLKAVTDDLFGRNVLSGNANQMHDQLKQDKSWRDIGTGPKAAQIAQSCLQSGQLVLAASKGDKNGHVAVVTDSIPPGPKESFSFRNLNASWGQHGGVGKQDSTLNFSWRKTEYEKVSFFCRDVP